MVSAVLFDLYETLITESGIQPTRASSLAVTLELEKEAYRRAWKARRPRVVRGEMSFAEALMEISQNLSGRVDRKLVQAICQQRVREKAVAYAQIHQEVAALVSTLAGRGIGLAVVSNGFEEDVVGWQQCSLARHFRCTVFSCAEHVTKPEPEIYRRAVHRLGVDPSGAVYLGDGEDDELGGAERAGLRAGRAAWFVSHSRPTGTWPVLLDCTAALRFVDAG